MNITTFALKEILADPKRCCTERWPDSETASAQYAAAVALVEEMHDLKPLLRDKKSAKQICSRDFGRIKAEGGDLDTAKGLMQQLSAELATLELRQKTLEDALLNLFAATEPATPRSPSRFAPIARSCTATLSIASVDTSDSASIAHWSRYVDGHPQASLYHDYRWRDVIHRSFGHETAYLMACAPDGTPHGVLPLVRLRSPLFGDFAVSMPFFNYGGVLADNSDVAQQLLDAATNWAQEHQLGHIEVRATTPLNDWPARTDKVSMIRPLPADRETFHREIGAKIRAQINRARQTKASVRIGGIELLNDFYRVFAINMRDLGTPVYGQQFFRTILEVFAQQAYLVVVYLDGKPVSTAFLLGYRDIMEIPWASTVRKVNALNINMLLYDEVLNFCIDQGYAFFDFGRSSKDSGTLRFKKQWGAEPVQHHWHYWLRDGGPLPELKPDSPKFRLLISVWQRLPVEISKLIGPHVVKYLP